MYRVLFYMCVCVYVYDGEECRGGGGISTAQLFNIDKLTLEQSDIPTLQNTIKR